MSDPYIGEIRMFGGTFAPSGWNFCDGSLLSTSEYDTLFNLVGTTYGGDGQNTFAVPDLRGRLPIHFDSSNPLGASSGSESVTLITQQLPQHNHSCGASSAAPTTASPTNAILGSNGDTATFIDNAPVGTMSAPLSPQGGNQPHDNMMPYLAVNFIISLFGIYPSQG